MTQKEEVSVVDTVMRARSSIRAFLPKPVERSLIEEILQVAGTAPSGTNTQPWQVHVLTGQSKNTLSEKILAVATSGDKALMEEEYAYYPATWVSPYVERRRKVGWDLYGLLGIGKEDKASMTRQQNRNYLFFDAPVGLFFTLDKVMGRGSLIDYGMFLQNLMLAAQVRGLATCPQAAFCHFHSTIKNHLRLDDNCYVICGMSLGYADPGKPENRLRTERMALKDFVHFRD